MVRIAKLLIGMSFLLLLDETISTADANIAGRFIGINDLTRTERDAVQRLTRSTGKKPWIIWGFRYGLDPKPDVEPRSHQPATMLVQSP